MNLWW